jgi:hypothetical protein
MIGELLQHDPVVLDALDELVRARADRFLGKVFGDMIMPARSESCESRVASARERLTFTVRSSTASTLSTEVNSLLRRESGRVRARSILAFTAAAFRGSPS